ncbi:hypothetical protein BMS3Bbin04_01850 [bacterium BMS3Bbin04]|nr:hypothetical protein BMS3Bbin04_01850 [bacterium BMS3Bbin04]
MFLARIPWKRIGKIAESALEGASVLWHWLKSK